MNAASFRRLINFPRYATYFYERNLKKNSRRCIRWTDLSLKLGLRCAGLFIQLPSSFSLRSCARRNLIYFAERSRWIFRVRLPSCVWFSRKYLRLYTTIRTHTRKFVVAQALLSREDARAYFVGSGPRYYFEIHEVEWRNRVRTKFGTGRREGRETEAMAKWPGWSNFCRVRTTTRRGWHPAREKKGIATPRRQTHSLFCIRQRKAHRRYLNICPLNEI